MVRHFTGEIVSVSREEFDALQELVAERIENNRQRLEQQVQFKIDCTVARQELSAGQARWVKTLRAVGCVPRFDSRVPSDEIPAGETAGTFSAMVAVNRVFRAREEAVRLEIIGSLHTPGTHTQSPASAPEADSSQDPVGSCTE